MSDQNPASGGPRYPVVGLAGSLRRDSFNRGLLEAIIRLAPPELVIEPYPLGRIPPYNADREGRRLPETVRRLKHTIEASDGLLIATPEYNRGVSGLLKNAIDWASRPPSDAIEEKHGQLDTFPTPIAIGHR